MKFVGDTDDDESENAERVLVTDDFLLENKFKMHRTKKGNYFAREGFYVTRFGTSWIIVDKNDILDLSTSPKNPEYVEYVDDLRKAMWVFSKIKL